MRKRRYEDIEEPTEGSLFRDEGGREGYGRDFGGRAGYGRDEMGRPGHNPEYPGRDRYGGGQQYGRDFSRSEGFGHGHLYGRDYGGWERHLIDYDGREHLSRGGDLNRGGTHGGREGYDRGHGGMDTDRHEATYGAARRGRPMLDVRERSDIEAPNSDAGYRQQLVQRRHLERLRAVGVGKGPRGYKRADHRIYEEVCDALTDHDLLDASAIEVTVRDGEVILRGEVSDRAARRLAEDISHDAAGVRDVLNDLHIRPAAPSKEWVRPATPLRDVH